MREFKEFYLIAISFQLASAWNIGGDQSSCASIHTEERYKGLSVKLKKGDQISNLWSHYGELSHPSLNTSSFKVQTGCHLNLCDDTDMTGECNRFDGDTPSLPSQWTSPKSVNCICPSSCNCSDVHLRVRECARMYLSKSCSNCDAAYTNLKNGALQELAISFQDKVKSIIVAKHCNVTLYGSSDSKGFIESEDLHPGEIIEDWEGSISSYQCSCKDSKHSRSGVKKQKTRSENLPALISIPKTPGQINSLLNGKYKEHPGLIASLQSMRSKRSPTNAYILLLGLTGAGKSTTINLLFDNSTITKVGDIRSTTTDINEYRIPIKVDELGISNSELRVIDTPGMVDTRGMEHDARYLATLKEYLDKHEDLKKYIPNVVLVFAKFNDNRFLGEGSTFVKMLRAIDLFRDKLVDRKYSNVIIVLTHFMSETKENTRKPSPRLEAIKKVIDEYSLFPKPVVIVVGENKPEGSDLLSVNGYFKLPNGDFYPRNLFDKMEEAVYSGEDPVGEAIIRTAFKNPDNFKISLKKFPLVPSSHSTVLHYLGVLSSFERSAESTDISQLLSEAFTTMDQGLKKKYPNALPYLKRALYKRNIQQVDHIPQTSIDILKFFQEIQINSANLYLLGKALNLTVPVFNSQSLVGYGYDILNDKPLFSTPFDFTISSVSDMGFQIPSPYTCEKKNQLKSVFHTFVSKEHYIKSRLASLNIQDDLPISAELLEEISPKPGMNIGDKENANRLTSLIEHRNFLFTLKDNSGVNLEFMDVLENLPFFNDTEWESVEAWKNFFETYGTHYVKSAYGGASMEIEIQEDDNNVEITNSSEMSTLFSTREKLASSMSNVMEFIANSLIRKTSSLDLTNTTYSIKYRGGDDKYFLKNLTQNDAIQVLENWRESIAFEPVMLQNDVTLIPIRELVMKIDEELGGELEKAALALFNASLVYNPPEREVKPEAPLSRENTNTQGMTGDYTIVKEFSSVFKTLADQARRANENFLALMVQQQKDAERMADEAREEKRQKMILEMEKLKIEAEEAKHKRDMEIELQRIQSEREILKAKFDSEMLSQRMKMNREAEVLAERQRRQEQESFTQLIIAENARAAQRKPWYEHVLDFGKTIVTSMESAYAKVIPAVLPAVLAAG